MIKFAGPLRNLLQHFTNHYLWLDTLDFWPHFTNPSLNCQSLLASRCTASGRTTQKIHPFSSSEYALSLRIRCRGMCLLSRFLAMDLCLTLWLNRDKSNMHELNCILHQRYLESNFFRTETLQEACENNFPKNLSSSFTCYTQNFPDNLSNNTEILYLSILLHYPVMYIPVCLYQNIYIRVYICDADVHHILNSDVPQPVEVYCS
jgi:hypothetical protein